VAADNLHLIWDLTVVREQSDTPDTGASGMTNGFSVSFPNGDAFMTEVGRQAYC